MSINRGIHQQERASTRSLELRGSGRIALVVLIALLLFFNNASATSSCGSQIRCRCANGKYDLVSPSQYAKEKYNPKSCCYRKPHKITVKSAPNVVHPQLNMPVVNVKGVEAHEKPQIESSPQEGIYEIEYLKPRQRRAERLISGSQSPYQTSHPIQILLSNFLSFVYNSRLEVAYRTAK